MVDCESEVLPFMNFHLLLLQFDHVLRNFIFLSLNSPPSLYAQIFTSGSCAFKVQRGHKIFSPHLPLPPYPVFSRMTQPEKK